MVVSEGAFLVVGGQHLCGPCPVVVVVVVVVGSLLFVRRGLDTLTPGPSPNSAPVTGQLQWVHAAGDRRIIHFWGSISRCDLARHAAHYRVQPTVSPQLALSAACNGLRQAAATNSPQRTASRHGRAMVRGMI